MSHAGVILGISDLEVEQVERDRGMRVYARRKARKWREGSASIRRWTTSGWLATAPMPTSSGSDHEAVGYSRPVKAKN